MLIVQKLESSKDFLGNWMNLIIHDLVLDSTRIFLEVLYLSLFSFFSFGKVFFPYLLIVLSY